MTTQHLDATGTDTVHTEGVYVVLDHDCAGPNKNCRAAHKAGRPVHVIPSHNIYDPARGRLVMPTYHFTTVAEGVAAIAAAIEHAVTPATDAEWLALEAAHEVPFYTIPGLNHPTRR